MKPYYQDEWTTIYHGDCREVLPLLVGLFTTVTDPPYGIKANKLGAHSSIRDNKKWIDEGWDNDRPNQNAFQAIINISEKAAIWGGNYFSDMLPVSPGWLVWRKPQAETGFSLADAELCWTSETFSTRMRSFPRRDGHMHPTQKPLGVMLWTIEVLGGTGTILDPYLGSGTTLRAAKDLRRRSIGIDIMENNCEISANRLAQEVLAL